MSSPRNSLVRLVILLAVCGLLMGSAGLVAAKGASQQKMAADQQMAAYELYQQKCLSCHDSIADPERPGKTRDGWTVVVRYMKDHYVQLSDQQADQIINLLYAIRKGLEKDPG